jgi:dienelactone hydrolase
VPRAYTVATAALALRMPVKWVDNILSHHKIGGIRQERQGIARRLAVEGLLTLALAAFLIRELGLPTRRAITLADEIIKSEGRYFGRQGLIVEIDLPAFQARLLEQLEAAVEMAPVPRRGRPPANKTGRLD